MALQTLNTIKQWFKTGLKPTQAQFWDTWDSFRHKFDKIPVKEVEGLDELLLSKADKTVLDHHLADKNAHAPQVNTDWNSESGFSQLLNKPEFKTINGESLTGDGDIIIEAGGSQDLQTTLANGNETTNGIMFNDDYYNWLKTSIDSRSIRLTDSNSDMLVAIDSAGVVTRDDSQHVSLNPQGIFFNRDTAESYLRINTSSTGVSTVNLPATEGAEITLTATDDFKTINGESIIGKGNLNIEPQGLKSVLDADPTASYGQSKATLMGDYDNSKYNELIVSDEIEKTGIYQLKNQLSFDHTALDSNDIGNITLSEGNIKLTRDKSNNQTVVDIADPVANTQLRFPAKSEEGKTYTIATTDDFKTINGESIVGSGDILINGGDGNIPTLQEVLDKDRNATNASINLLSEEGESQTTVHEGGLNISEKTETGFLITDINKLGVSVSKDEETTFVNISADELSLNKNLSGNPVKQGIVLNEDSAGTSTIKLPLTSDGDVKTLAATDDFKTINGESIVGEGDITIGGGNGDIPTLQQVLDSGNETENSKVILRAGVTSVGTNIIDGYAVEMRLDNRILVANTSQVALTAGNKGSQLVPEGLKSFDNQGTMNILNYPYKPFGTYTLATLEDIPSGGSQTLDQTLGFGNVSDKTIELTEGNKTNELSSSLLKISQKNTQTDWKETEISLNEGIKFTVAGFGMSRSINLKPQLQNTDDVKSTVFIPNRTGTIALLDDVSGVTLNSMFDYGGGTRMTGGKYISITNGNLYAELGSNELTMRNGDVYAEYGSSGISWSTEGWLRETTLTGWNGGGANFDLPNKPAATTQVLTVRSDFKTINGESIVGEGNLVIGGGGSQNLQSVLNAGSEAILTDFKEYSLSTSGDPTGTGRSSRFILSGVDLDMRTLSDNFKKESGFGADSGTGEMRFFSFDALTDGTLNLRLPRSPIVNTNILVPNKPIAGDYTLATTDDVFPIAKSITGTSYQLVQNDRLLIYEGTDEIQINIPPEGIFYPSYPIGYKIQIVRGNTGTLNINRMPGVDMVSDYNTKGLKPYHSVMLTKIGTNRWYVESLETHKIILPYEQDTILTLDEYQSDFHHIFQSNVGSTINLALNNAINEGSTYKYTQEGDGALTLVTNGNVIVTTLPLVTTKGESRTLTKIGDNKWLMEGTLATTDDVNLQSTLEGGNSATLNGGTLMLLGKDKAPLTSLVYINGAETNSTIVSITPEVIDITVDQGEGQSGINLNKSGFKLNFNGQTLVSDPIQPNTDYKEVKIPFVTVNSTLATTDDIKLKSYTVSTLPIGAIGDQAYVTDATAPTYLGTLIGGGSVVCPVFYNGTTWVAH